MSYILEALKKSDQARQQGAAPTLMSVQLPVEETRQESFPWLVVLAAVVFITGILIGWLQPWNSGQSAATVQSPTADKMAVQAPEANPPTITSTPPSNASVDSGAALARAPVQVQSPAPMPAAPPPRVAVLPAPTKPILPQVARADSPATAIRTPAVEQAPVAPAKAVGATEQNVMTKAELPPAIQQELPPMAVSLHAYSSKPSNRLVGINDKLLQEGDALMPGLILEEVTRKDMIFSYKGYRFRQGVQ